MNDPRPVYIADTCIGGLSVVKSLWKSGHAANAVFMAEYEVTPLGVKSDRAIAGVLQRWVELAEVQSQTLVMACNTLSIRHHQLYGLRVADTGVNHIVSMVDCFEAMVRTEIDRLTGKRILVIGTEFTAAQSLYPDILNQGLNGSRVETIGATELERKIARFEPRKEDGSDLFDLGLRTAIDNADVAVLACTCFPMVMDKLEILFPDVLFLDPGRYCSGLLIGDAGGQSYHLSVRVTGDVVSPATVAEFAGFYLDDGSGVSVELSPGPGEKDEE